MLSRAAFAQVVERLSSDLRLGGYIPKPCGLHIQALSVLTEPQIATDE